MAEKLMKGMVAPDFNFTTPWQNSNNFYQCIEEKKSFLFFLRYYGCTMCQLEIHYLINDYQRFADKGAQVFVVLQSDPNLIKKEVEEGKIPFIVICDVEQSLYKLYHVTSALCKPAQPSPTLLKKRKEVQRIGLVHGVYEGDELQLPATFLINEKKLIKFAHYGTDSADIPDHDTLLALV